MLRGLYTAASGMMAQEVSQNVLADNLANSGTPGFKAGQAVQASFPWELINSVGALGTGTLVDDVVLDQTPGRLEASQAPLSAALQGDGYFAVSTANGVRLTRDGEFRLAANGTLVTMAGDPVLGQSGFIHGQAGLGELRVTPTGDVYQGDRPLGRLRIVQPPAGAVVVKDAGNLLRLDQVGGGPLAITAANLPAASATLAPGLVESSNVDVVQSMSQLLMVARAYEASQHAFKVQDQALQVAVTEVGRA